MKRFINEARWAVTSSVEVSKENRKWSEAQRIFYNSRRHKRMWYVENSAFVKNVLERFIPFAGLQREHKILEVGCGAGRYTIPLLRLGYNVTGIDISEGMLEKLKEDFLSLKLPQNPLRLLKGDLNTFNFELSDPYDVIVGFNVLHHLFDMRTAISHLSISLKPGGLIAFVEPNGRNPLHEIDAWLDCARTVESHKSMRCSW